MDEEVGGEAEVDVAEGEVGLMIEVGEVDSRTDEVAEEEVVITTKEVNLFMCFGQCLGSESWIRT